MPLGEPIQFYPKLEGEAVDGHDARNAASRLLMSARRSRLTAMLGAGAVGALVQAAQEIRAGHQF